MATVELISTGAELLSGRTLNRHGHVLGAMLKTMGLRLVRDTTVPDDREMIEEAIAGAIKRSALVIVTGGLGPTDDDISRDAAAAVLGRPLIHSAEAFEEVNSRYGEAKPEGLKFRMKQAEQVEGAEMLLNPVGTAPGQCIPYEGGHLFLVPGPPNEFLAVMQQHIMPWLARHAELPVRPQEQVFMLSGVGETEVQRKLSESGLPKQVDVAYCAAPGRVELTLQSHDVPALVALGNIVRQKLGPHIFAEERKALEDAVGALMVAKKKTVSVAESCTGGLIGGRLTMVPGSSSWFVGGVISYTNEVKERELGVKAETLAAVGAVSRETATEMAEGARSKFDTDVAIAVTGIAGPDGGSADKPVGLVYVALADREKSWVREMNLSGDRMLIRERTIGRALDLLRQWLDGMLV